MSQHELKTCFTFPRGQEPKPVWWRLGDALAVRMVVYRLSMCSWGSISCYARAVVRFDGSSTVVRMTSRWKALMSCHGFGAIMTSACDFSWGGTWVQARWFLSDPRCLRKRWCSDSWFKGRPISHSAFVLLWNFDECMWMHVVVW